MEAKLSEVQRDTIRSFFEELVKSGRTPGAGVAIAINGAPAFQFQCGMARPGMPASEETLWPIASISKLYTASVVMRLVETGRLALGAKAVNILSNFTECEREHITVRQLLTHTSGLPYEPEDMEELISRGASIEEIRSAAYFGKLEFSPGTRQLYSDLGYALLGQIAEVVTRQPFASLINELVASPAGLHSTFADPPVKVLHRIAEVEGPLANGTPNAMYNSVYSRRLAHPAFGIVTSLSDMLHFGLQFDPLRFRSIHSRAGIQAMTTDQTNGDMPGELERIIVPTGVIHAWGAGFMIKGRSGTPELVSPTSYGHGGASGCYLWIDPVHRTTIAIVSRTHSNANPADFFPRIDQSLNVVMSTLTSKQDSFHSRNN